jgi:hypothetical protein
MICDNIPELRTDIRTWLDKSLRNSSKFVYIPAILNIGIKDDYSA